MIWRASLRLFDRVWLLVAFALVKRGVRAG
jgi:hypothetical protein